MNKKEISTPLLSFFIVVMFISPGKTNSADAMPIVKLYDPKDIAPMLREDSKFLMNGMSVHRRVINKPKDGSVHIDVGYNTYKAGVGANKPYAYTKDELCYIPSGVIMAISDGEKVMAKAGYFMWRPARAATQRTRVVEDSVTICAFAPARDDEWSHRLPQSEIGKWGGDPADKPAVIFRHYRDIEPMMRPGDERYSDGWVIHRRIFTKPNDGTEYIDASHNVYKAGLETGPYAYTHDEVCWLESGEIEMVNNGKKQRIYPGQFMYRPAGAVTEYAKVLKDSVSICFFAPAREDAWSHLVPVSKVAPDN